MINEASDNGILRVGHAARTAPELIDLIPIDSDEEGHVQFDEPLFASNGTNQGVDVAAESRRNWPAPT
jgi:hypothetical protein